MLNNKQNKIRLICKEAKLSKSSLIHNAIYKYLGLNYTYEAISFSTEKDVECFISNESNLISNVTYPYKHFCFNLLKNNSLVDKASKFCEASNLIINNKWLYNFDGLGLRYFLQLKNINLSGKKILICGTGATAKSIYFALNNMADKIYFCSRNVQNFSNYHADVISYTCAGNQLGSFDMVIDARPLLFEEKLLNLNSANKDCVVIDVSYADNDTGIVSEAKKLNLKNFDGHGMLICQAILTIQKICETLNIENSQIKDFKKLYNIGLQAINYK